LCITKKSGDVVLRKERRRSSALKNLQETKKKNSVLHKLPILITSAYLFCLILIAAGQKYITQDSIKYLITSCKLDYLLSKHRNIHKKER